MNITWNGDQFYGVRSHANINRGLVTALTELGHKIKVTNILDTNLFKSNNKAHAVIKDSENEKFNSDFNIFKFPAIKVMTSAKFNCILHSDGSYTSTVTNNNRIKSCPSTHLWLPTPDCANEVNKYTPIPTIGLGVDSGIDPTMFNPGIEPFDFDILKSTFKFFIACDGGNSTAGRPHGGFRGSDIAIEAFIDEFSNKDDVCLIVKVAHNYKIIDDFIVSSVLKKPNVPKIIKDYGNNQQGVMAAKLKSADCMLSPIRDCRWEACILEALACGTPTIATNCGGPRLYGKYGVYFIDYKITDADLHISRGDIAVGKEYWTEPSVDGFRKKMREVYNNRKAAEEFGMKGSVYVTENWKWIDIAQRIIDFFNKN